MSKDGHHFVVPYKYYLGTFIALLFLTVITVVASRMSFGPFDMAVALLIAAVKAGLVLTIFMGLKWDRGFNVIAILGSFIFLIIFILFTASDYFYRARRDPVEATFFNIETKVKPIDKSKYNGKGKY